MQNSIDAPQKKSRKRQWRVALAVIVVAALGATLQQGLLQDVLKDLRRYDSASIPSPITDESETAVFDVDDIRPILAASEFDRSDGDALVVDEDDLLELVGFDPLTTPTVSGIDLDRLIHAAQNLDPDRSCPRSELPATVDEVVEILRFADGCLLIGYEELDGRTVEEVREQNEADTSILAIDRPALAFPLQSQGDPQASEQWHLDAVDAATLQSGWPDGAEVTVAVFDTGVDATHADLDANVLVGFGTGDGRLDSDGHGTHVAGIIAAEADNGEDGRGVAPSVSILPLHVIGGGALSLTDALNRVIERHEAVDIVNMSLSTGSTENQVYQMDSEPNQNLEAIIREAQLLGIIVVAAAGNCGSQRYVSWIPFHFEAAKCRYAHQIAYPAGYPGVVSVAATAESGERADFSSTGTEEDIAASRFVDIAAPGEDILSTVPGNGMAP